MIKQNFVNKISSLFLFVKPHFLKKINLFFGIFRKFFSSALETLWKKFIL